jgi:response regulator RpfG family c-di-GMP phosphodiesterase
MSPFAIVASAEAPLREELGLALTGIRCEVAGARTVAEVLARLTGDDPPAIVVLDPFLPGADHAALSRRLQDTDGKPVVVMLADPGRPPDGWAEIDTIDVFRFLIRPWDQTALRVGLQAAVTRANLLAENERLAALQREQERILVLENERLALKAQEATKLVTEAEAASSAPPETAVAMGAAALGVFDTKLHLHATAVSAASRDLARALGLPEESVHRIELAGLLHDIGYLGLPRSLLVRSKDRLTDGDLDQIREHPLLGEKIVGVDQTMRDIARLVRHHHENFDGTGHPDGLVGGGIALGARIIHLTDMYDRAYSLAAGLGGPAARTRARRTLGAARGKALDPRLVDIFLEGTVLRADLREIQIHVENLQAGMTLTRDLRTGNDLFLAAGGTRLDETHGERIQTFHRKRPILAEVYVRT